MATVICRFTGYRPSKTVHSPYEQAALRKSLEITIEDVSSGIDYDQKTIRDYERGKNVTDWPALAFCYDVFLWNYLREREWI